MFNLRETNRYNVNTKAALTGAIESAYYKAQTVLPKDPPDLFLLISSCISYAILILMTVLTAFGEEGNQKILWYLLAALCVFLLGMTLVKYFKNIDAYKKDTVTVNKAEKKTEAFLNLFEADTLPERMPAGELSKKVSALLGKQSDNIINNALRELSSTLNSKNNPSDILCKNLTPMGDMFPNPRSRFYFKATNTGYIFYDADFTAPAGELECESDDLLAYGLYASFSESDKAIISASGKFKQDSCIMKLSDGCDYYFFEFHPGDYAKLKKVLPARKEL